MVPNLARTGLGTIFVISGCGRSGTGWAAALFTALGFPCGHEKSFNTERSYLSGAESSWLAVPWLHALPRGVPVLRVMRDPHDVAASAWRRGFLNDPEDEYRRYVTEHRPDIIRVRDDHLGRVIRWVAAWDSPLEGAPLLRVDSSPSEVSAVVEYATAQRVPVEQASEALTQVGTVNSDDGPELDRDTLTRHPNYHLIGERAERYGYEV